MLVYILIVGGLGAFAIVIRDLLVWRQEEKEKAEEYAREFEEQARELDDEDG